VTGDVAATMDIVVGLVIAAFIAFMMFRMFQFASGRAQFRRRGGA
jgi:hypothetical protein